MALDLIVHSIQMSVAPVFLLTGIAGLLNVLTTRLSRIIDRYRRLHDDAGRPLPNHIPELRMLYRRSKYVHRAITLATISALMVCLVVALLFIGAELDRDTSLAISLLFIAAMVLLTGALVMFIREIGLAAHTLVPVGKDAPREIDKP